MSSVLAPALAAIRRGRFNSALLALQACPEAALGSAKNLHQALLAEMLQCTGRTEAATDLVSRLLKSGGLSQSTKSRCYTVLGAISFDNGGAKEALRHFQQAVRLAEAAGDLPQLCRAQIEILYRLADISAPASVSALTVELGRNIRRCGDVQLQAALHVGIGEIEGKRGFLENSVRHINAGLGLLQEDPNAWLEGMLKLDLSVVGYVTGDVCEAIQHANAALKCAEDSGHARTSTAALANLGLLMGCAGDFGRAQEFLRLALNQAAPEKKRTILDSYARVKLAERDLDQCELLIEQIEHELPRDPHFQHSYYDLAVYETRTRLLQKRGRWEVAVKVATEAVGVSNTRSDQFAAARYKLLMADSLIALGDVEQAVALISDAGERLGDASFSAIAEFETIQARAFVRLGQRASANDHFWRALRIFNAIGQHCDFIAVQAECKEASQKETQGELAQESHITPTMTAAFFSLASHPELLGREGMAALRQAACANRAALVVRRGKQAAEVLEADNWPESDLRPHLQPIEEASALFLGARGERRFYLLIEPRDELAARTTVVAIRKLLDAAVALETAHREAKQRDALWPPEPGPDASPGVFISPQTLELLATARKIAPTELPVLLTGETGTGKELLARAIHQASPRAERIFLPFNCTAVPRETLDSQLFGHRRGAFTGAHENFPGVIRSAAGGTLFLDEIGELGPDVQPKLLRFLETGEIHPLGEPKPMKVDVRVIAATNANLDQLVTDGRFREDLFYRLNVIRFKMPALRERREEIPALAHHFVRRYGEDLKKGRVRLGDDTLEYLLVFGWPGNVRQLGNEIRRMVALAEPDSTLTPEMLSDEVRSRRRSIAEAGDSLENEIRIRVDQTMSTAIEHLERVMVSAALDASDGRVDAAARRLGLSRKGLYLKRRRLGIGVTLH